MHRQGHKVTFNVVARSLIFNALSHWMRDTFLFKGILSTNFAASMEGLSTVKDSYAPASPVKVQNMGKRQELLTRQIYEMVR